MKRFTAAFLGASMGMLCSAAHAISFQALTPGSIPSSGPWNLTIAVEFSASERDLLLGSLGMDDGSGGFSGGAIGVDLIDFNLPVGVSIVIPPGQFEAPVAGLPAFQTLLNGPFAGKVEPSLSDPLGQVNIFTSAEAASFGSYADFLSALNAVPPGVVPLFSFEVEGVPDVGASVSFIATVTVVPGDTGGMPAPPVEIPSANDNSTLQPIPEPSTWLTLGSGLALLAGFRMTRRNRQPGSVPS